MKYNTHQEELPYKQYRICLTNSVLIEACKDIQHQKSMGESELLKKALTAYLEQEEFIEIEKT